MTVKTILRLIIACAIVWLILSFALPLAGIPHSRMLPAPIAFAGSARGVAQGFVTAKDTKPTSNIFHSMDTDYLVDYQFRAPSVPDLGNKPPKEPTTVYKGEAKFTSGLYGNTKIGDIVPVKYDPADPENSGIDLPEAGRNIAGHGSFFGIWIIIWIVTLILGYILSPWLERIILRENF